MNYDVAVIGGGPAGMVAAGRAALSGARVVLLEKNSRPGVKLLLTGGGRCNFTNVGLSARMMADRYGPNGKFFISALTRFDADAAIAFFEEHGVASKVEDHGRVFPLSGRAEDILKALLGFLKKNNVVIRTGVEISSCIRQNTRIEKVITTTGEAIIAGSCILATGGKSYTATGSTGDGYRWLEDLGHRVVAPAPALCAILTKGPAAGDLQGLSLKDIPVTAWKQGKKIAASIGDLLFTANGLSGPAIYDISCLVGKKLPGDITLSLDLLPGQDLKETDRILVELLSGHGRKLLRSILAGLLADKLVSAALRQCAIDERKTAGTVTREERQKIVAAVKGLTFKVDRPADFDKATVTAGGVSLNEVDSKTMRSAIFDNLFFAGEILDLDGPTGGFNLQMCWSTGMAAGEAAGNPGE